MQCEGLIQHASVEHLKKSQLQIKGKAGVSGNLPLGFTFHWCLQFLVLDRKHLISSMACTRAVVNYYFITVL